MAETFAYDTLANNIERAREKTAKFFLVDLHLHTTDSHDYPSVHSKIGFVSSVPHYEKALKNDREEFKQHFINHANEKNLRLVAITDHNESDMAEYLSRASDEKLAILPGIEISVQTNLFPESEVHILGIFPEGTTSKHIDKVFPPGCGMPESGKRGPGVRTTQPLKEIISNIKALDGLSVAAHVSSTGGIRVMVHSQNIEWLQKNYLRRYLKSKSSLSDKERNYLDKLQKGLKPLDDEVQDVYLKFLAEHDFNAIQIQDAEHQNYYSGEHAEALNVEPFACLLSTDAHTLADIGCYGHRTYIKMTQIGLEGLSKALHDPGTRIRYDTTVPSEKPPRILGLALEGGSFDGEIIGFSDNLTTLIGGRGTGKSAIIEAIRYVLCHPIDDLPQKLRRDIEDRLDFTLRDAEIKLLFMDEHDCDLVILKRRYGESKTSCYSIDGKPLPEITLPLSQRIRAEIYGWNEIEELSDSPRKQLNLLDRTIPGIEDLKLDIRSKLGDLRVNGEKVVSLSREIQDLLPQIQDASEVRLQLSRLDDPQLNQAFKKFDQNERALSELESLIKKVDDDVLSWLLEDGNAREISKDLLRILNYSEEKLQEYNWFSYFSKSVQESFNRVQELYDQTLQELNTAKKEFNNQIDILKEERKIIESELNSLSEQSGQGDFKTELSRRKELTEKISTIEGHENEIEDKKDEIERLLKIRMEQIVPSLNIARGQMYAARHEKAKAIADNLSELHAAKGIVIIIDELGDTVAFSKALGYRDGSRYEGIFKGIDKQYLRMDYPGFFSLKFSPHEFVNIFLRDVAEANILKIRYIRKLSGKKDIVELVDGEVKLREGSIIVFDENGSEIGSWSSKEFEYVEVDKAAEIWEYLSPLFYDGEVNKYFDQAKLEKLLELELIDIEDRPIILLNDNPIEELSPGQRCSALIPIILVEGDHPLIIDQPEDNLDNKLVFDLVVDILRGLKERRQIIVATHNPNIPVSGDAEQVVVFDSPRKEKCCAVEQASIDDANIISQIKSVMEGGEKAFEMRMIKYGVLQKA